MSVRIGVLIATYNRPESLSLVLASLVKSTLRPSIVVISDASNADNAKRVNALVANFSSELNLVKLHSKIGSLCHQRNLGKEILAREDLFAVQVLDDDTEVTETYIATLASFLQSNPSVVGVSGVSVDPESPPVRFAKLKRVLFSIVGLDGFKPGSITSAGVGMKADLTGGVRPVSWLFGCAMWRSNVFASLQYQDELRGSCLFEDVDFSMRASTFGELIVMPEAKLIHSLSGLERPNAELYAYRFSRNRLYVIENTKRKFLSFTTYIFSVFVLFLLYGVRGIFSRSREKRLQMRSAGRATWRGFYDGVSGKAPR